MEPYRFNSELMQMQEHHKTLQGEGWYSISAVHRSAVTLSCPALPVHSKLLTPQSALLLLSTASVMSYYMDPVSSYPALHPCDRLGAMRQSGGVAVGPQTQLPGVVHPQQQYYPSQPLYPQDIPLQEVPNEHDMCPTAVRTSGALSESVVVAEEEGGQDEEREVWEAKRLGGGWG
ncbi:protein C-ets-1 isoform X2 [Lates japonicus]|uniref:Protein C-ets-1 isoform X2 n=1 Tax=Lates japonicus TaxID=270547 RepID=A0AAD3M2K9_LATJO|nr:protein C-ets-1 isoform X2 [Lates japonicus]